MDDPVLMTDDITFEQVLVLAQRLKPVDQARLVARLAPQVEQALKEAEPVDSAQQHTLLRGLLADLGPAPTAEDIDEVQREMWSGLTQE